MTPEQFNMEIYGLDTAIALSELEKEKASERVAELRYRKALFIQNTMALAVQPPSEQQPSEPVVGVTPPPVS